MVSIYHEGGEVMCQQSKPCTPEMYISKFQALALQIGPNFRHKDATDAQAWSSHTSTRLGLTFNAVKKLAGLPVIKERTRMGIAERKTEYVSCLEPQTRQLKSDRKPIKLCLGYGLSGNGCTKKVPKGEYFCPWCREHKNNQ